MFSDNMGTLFQYWGILFYDELSPPPSFFNKLLYINLTLFIYYLRITQFYRREKDY